MTFPAVLASESSARIVGLTSLVVTTCMQALNAAWMTVGQRSKRLEEVVRCEGFLEREAESQEGRTEGLGEGEGWRARTWSPTVGERVLGKGNTLW